MNFISARGIHLERAPCSPLLPAACYRYLNSSEDSLHDLESQPGLASEELQQAP
jgi:hypothetical protein